VVSGVVNIGGDRFPSGQLLVLRPDSAITLRNAENETARIVLVAVR
jgi:redox-sensitive bicupin YhaK (pirin superfamily)